MARPLRIELAGGLYHVMSRGNDRRAIVRDDADRQRRLDWLERTVQTYGWRLHAFALMTNHEHLFLETPEPNLSAGMHLLNSSYTGYFNLRHRRAGHLFQGRFKAHLVEEEGYFTEISRYIHLNPVRASWSSGPNNGNGAVMPAIAVQGRQGSGLRTSVCWASSAVRGRKHGVATAVSFRRAWPNRPPRRGRMPWAACWWVPNRSRSAYGDCWATARPTKRCPSCNGCGRGPRWIGSWPWWRSISVPRRAGGCRAPAAMAWIARQRPIWRGGDSDTRWSRSRRFLATRGTAACGPPWPRGSGGKRPSANTCHPGEAPC